MRFFKKKQQAKQLVAAPSDAFLLDRCIEHRIICGLDQTKDLISYTCKGMASVIEHAPCPSLG